MESKLEKILDTCSFLSDEQVHTLRNNAKIFDILPPSKGLFRNLSENSASFDDKLDLMSSHKNILVGLPSSCLSLLFRRSLEKTIQRVLSVPELQALGLEGQAIGLVLKNGDVNEKVQGAKDLKALGVEGQAIGLVLNNGDVNEKVQGAKDLQALGVEGHSIGLVLQSGDVNEKVQGAR